MNKIFEQNPQLQVVFVTSDGTPFYNEGDAKNHGKSLENKSVETVYNPNHLQVVDSEDSEDVNDEAAEIAKFEKAEKTVDLNKLSKAKLLEFAQENQLTVAEPTATNAVIVAELQAQLNTIA